MADTFTGDKEDFNKLLARWKREAARCRKGVRESTNQLSKERFQGGAEALQRVISDLEVILCLHD